VGISEFLLSVGANAEIADKAGLTVQDHVRTILEESRRKLKSLKAKGRLADVHNISIPGFQS
jgi:hypothetical protein